MKTKQFFYVSLIALLTLTQTACVAQNTNTKVISRNFTVTAFSYIDNNTVGNIEFTQSPNHSVSVEGDEEMVNNLLVKVENNQLKLSNKKDFKKIFGNRKTKKLTIYISSPQLTAIESDGVGNILLKGTLNTPKLEITSNGVGNIKSENLVSETIIIDSEGVGNIELIGKTTSLSVSSEGVGNINTRELIARNVKIDSDGVGNTSCYASESVDIRTDGVGNVRYYGNPQTKNIRKGGIGKVKAGE